MGSTRKDIGWPMWKYCFQLDSKQIQLVVDMLSKGSPILQNQYVTEQGVNNSCGSSKGKVHSKNLKRT
jgi:hypothetical protein